jgi:hypothetical protein
MLFTEDTNTKHTNITTIYIKILKQRRVFTKNISKGLGEDT